MGVLAVLVEGPASAPQIARRIGVDARTTLRILRRLAEDRYAELVDPRGGIRLWAVGPRSRELGVRLLIARSEVVAAREEAR